MHDTELIPWLLLGGMVAIGLYFVRRAPAVSLGVLGGIVGAVIGFNLANVGEDPAFGTRFMGVGLVGLGLVGLAFRPLASSRSLMFAAICTLIATPLAIWVAWRVMPSLTCRAWYSTHDRWCPEGDPLGGTSGQITSAAVFVTIVFAGLLLASAWRARGARAGLR